MLAEAARRSARKGSDSATSVLHAVRSSLIAAVACFPMGRPTTCSSLDADVSFLRT